MKKSLMALLFGTTLILGACGGGESSESEPPEETPEETPAGEESSVDAEQVVNQNCIPATVRIWKGKATSRHLMT